MAQQVSNEFGIEFVNEDQVPDAPRQNDRNPALWKAVTIILRQAPNNWAKVRTFDKPSSAAAKASAINSGRNKAFPADQWEARYSRGDGDSKPTLFMLYKGPKMTKAEAEKAEAETENSSE